MENRVILKMSMFREIPQRGEYVGDEIYQSDYATVAYVALRCLYDVKKSEIKITPKDMLKVLGYDTTKRLQREKENLLFGLELLADYDIIAYEKSGNSYVVDTTGLYLDMCPGGDLTFSVPKDYIQELAKQKNSFALMHHYLLLCSTINVMGKHYGMMAQGWFAEKLGVKEVKTIRTRHQLFEILGLIIFSQHRNTTNKNGEFVNIPKLYTMPYDAKEIEELANTQLKKSVSSANKAIKKAKQQEKQEKVAKVELPKKSENPFGNNPFATREIYEKLDSDCYGDDDYFNYDEPVVVHISKKPNLFGRR